MDKMTIYYMKSNGKIMAVSGGIQDMGYYGENETDFSLIIDFAVFTIDAKVFFNFADYKINTESKIIEIRPEAVTQYPVAAQ